MVKINTDQQVCQGTMFSWYTRKTNSALLHTAVLIYTAAKAIFWKGSVTHTCYSATSAGQLFDPDKYTSEELAH